MAILNNKKIHSLKNGFTDLIYTNPLNELPTSRKRLSFENVINNKNDIQLNNITNKYPEILNILKKSK